MFPRSLIHNATLAIVGSAIFLALSLPADAARRKGKTCKGGHIHYRSSTGQRSKKVARKNAIAAWAEFTAFEYGNAWANFKRSGYPIIRCSHNVTGWGCKVEAEPCRR